MDNSLICLSRQYYFDLKHYFSLGDRREDKFKQEGCLYKYAYELDPDLIINKIWVLGIDPSCVKISLDLNIQYLFGHKICTYCINQNLALTFLQIDRTLRHCKDLPDLL